MKPVLMRAVAWEWVLCALLVMAASAQRQQTDLTNLQIEDLMNVDVTSASRKEQKISRVPAAIFLIALRENESVYPGHWGWTTSAYFVGRLAAPRIASYTRLDVNLAWRPSDRMWLGVVGQNLLQDFHQEYAGSVLTVTPSLVRRIAYARLTWWF
jgi:hypothetical protein